MRQLSRLARVAVCGVALATGASVVGGCASIPSSGPVQEGVEVRSDRDQPFIRVLARPPRPEMTPEQVVSGFLAASASFDRDHAVAREYLTPDQQESWRPETGVVVYEGGDDVLSTPTTGTMLLSASQVATISDQGEYTPAAPDARASGTFVLSEVDGEWRIASLPQQGLMLTSQDVDRTFRSFNLYFPDPTGRILVPNQVVLPVSRPGVAASLVRALLAGPTDWLTPAVRTAFPEGTALAVDSTPVENGVARVDLTSAALSADADARESMSAQLVWTLGQLSEVNGVRITVQGVPFRVEGVPEVQQPEEWDGVDPDGLAGTADPYAIVDGALHVLLEQQTVPAAGPLGDGSVQVTRPAVSPSRSLAAGLTAGGASLVVAPLAADGVATTAVNGLDLTPPSFDVFDTAWTVDRRPTGPAVWAVPNGGAAVAVQAPELAGRRVEGLHVARDGVRAAVVVDGGGSAGGQLFLARVLRSDAGIVLEGLRPIASRLTDVRDVAWFDADRLVVLASDTTTAVEPFFVGLDGDVTRVPGGLSNGVSLTAAPGRPILAADTAGVIRQSTENGWPEVTPGTDPAYPG